MLVAELQELEEVKGLITKGQQFGVLTFGDVASAVSEVDLDESDVEDLYGHIERQGIELVEDVVNLMERHFDGAELGGVVAEIDKLFGERFDALVNSLEIGKRPRGSGGSGGPGAGGHGGGRRPRHLH